MCGNAAHDRVDVCSRSRRRLAIAWVNVELRDVVLTAKGLGQAFRVRSGREEDSH
jgi:hypothetical protein